MRKNYIYILLLFVNIALLLTACNTSDDLYVNPSKPLEGSPQSILTPAQVNTFMSYEGEYARLASILTGQMAGVYDQYSDFQNYSISENAFINEWEALYTRTMHKLNLLITTYSNNYAHHTAIAKVMMAINLGLATDLYGDVPYSEAFQAKNGNYTPKYDKQEDVIKAIQQLLTEAITIMNDPKAKNIETPSTDDLIFKGDMKAWERAAWLLKARYANRLSLKNASESANDVIAYTTKALSIELATKAYANMQAIHNVDHANQWFDFYNSRGYTAPNAYFIQMLVDRNDPRLAYYFLEAMDKDAQPLGYYLGFDIVIDNYYSTHMTDNTNAPSSINYKSKLGGYFSPDRNFPLLTEFEAYFLLAEAKHRLGQDPSADLNTAILKSVEYVTAGKASGSTLAHYSATTATIENIMTEKWIGMFAQIEVYNDWRRTGLPATIPIRPQPVGAVSNFIPVRMPTPQTERLYNPNAKTYKLDEALWWAKP